MSDVMRSDDGGVLRVGAAVSVVQSVLFVVIGVTALALGVDRLVEDGFASFAATDSGLFRVLCAAFVTIAILGIAITPAERRLVERSSPAGAQIGATLALLGHAGTIAYFAWWLAATRDGDADLAALAAVAPIEFGAAWELGLVGGWVWIIAVAARRDRAWPRGFVAVSVFKGCCFWAALAALCTDQRWLIVVGLGAVTFVAGPVWHLWIAKVFLDHTRNEAL